MPTKPIAIELDGVTKEYAGGAFALRPTSLLVPEGEWLVLMGPSGCGKTTTLRLIAGLETPTAGVVRLKGKSATGLSCADRDIAMVFQRTVFFPDKTVRQNLEFGLRLRAGSQWGATGADIAERVAQAARWLKIERLLDRPAAQLSGGEQQRMALGRALVRHAGVALLDEPLGHLDASLRKELRRELPLLRDRFPPTMILVTHDPAEAVALGDRIAVMENGVICQVGAADELRRVPANDLVAELFGT